MQALFGDNEESRRKILRSFKAKIDAKRTLSERMADWTTSRFGSMAFLSLNIVFFILWLLINTGYLDFISVFDPFPFNLLTMFVSLEAIILAIFVLISQNRTLKVDELRAETQLQINLIAEKEITKVMKMLAILLDKQGVDFSQDPELKSMLRPLSEEEIEKRLEKEILR